MTRRKWFRCTMGSLISTALAGRARAARPNWVPTGEAQSGAERRYRADAQVLLFGISLLRRQGVGGGHAAWREWRDGIRQLEFAGYSLPERAAGLSRLGFIRETSRPAGAGAGECVYFGLMTASPEESAEEARKALHSNAKDATYTAIDGSVAPGEVETALVHFTAPARVTPAEWPTLEDRARQALASAAKLPLEYDAAKTAAPPFLHALASALRQAPTETRYSYRGRLYRLWLRAAADAKATAEFRQRGLLAEGRNAVRVAGVIQRLPEGKPINFHVWTEHDAARPIPLRIDYQPKGYLRLTFEAV